MAYVVTEACVDVLDKSCTAECPVDCIYEGGRMMYINPDECVDCGACEPVCPTQAIYYEDDVPKNLLAYVNANAIFFIETGVSGGAEAAGKSGVDAPLIKGLGAT